MHRGCLVAAPLVGLAVQAPVPQRLSLRLPRRHASEGAGSMASVFVSHSNQDRAVTERVVARLRAAGFAALFIDFDPEQDIPAGRNWERELYVQLRRSDAVVFLASEASVASRWCFAELRLARSLGRPVSRGGRLPGRASRGVSAGRG